MIKLPIKPPNTQPFLRDSQEDSHKMVLVCKACLKEQECSTGGMMYDPFEVILKKWYGWFKAGNSFFCGENCALEYLIACTDK